VKGCRSWRGVLVWLCGVGGGSYFGPTQGVGGAVGMGLVVGVRGV